MERHLRMARIITNLLENKFELGKFKFGFDPILGIIPGIGDVLTFGISFYLIWIGFQIRLPNKKIFEMISNILIDFFIGLLPVIGDFTDVIYRANSRNLKILEEFSSQVVEADSTILSDSLQVIR